MTFAVVYALSQSKFKTKPKIQKKTLKFFVWSIWSQFVLPARPEKANKINRIAMRESELLSLDDDGVCTSYDYDTQPSVRILVVSKISMKSQTKLCGYLFFNFDILITFGSVLA